MVDLLFLEWFGGRLKVTPRSPLGAPTLGTLAVVPDHEGLGLLDKALE
jgi:hypothetical protein